MIKYKGLKPVEDFPARGIYTKIGKTILAEFQNSKQTKAEIEIEYNKLRQLLSLYNAIKSLIRRSNPPLKLTVHIDRKEGKLYLAKEDAIIL